MKVVQVRSGTEAFNSTLNVLLDMRCRIVDLELSLLCFKVALQKVQPVSV